jgi:hypothetical protein
MFAVCAWTQIAVTQSDKLIDQWEQVQFEYSNSLCSKRENGTSIPIIFKDTVFLFWPV